MSVLNLKPKQAVQMSSIGEVNCAVNEDNNDSFLLHFEGYDKRAVFIKIQKHYLKNLLNVLKAALESGASDE